jgi:glycerol kinase
MAATDAKATLPRGVEETDDERLKGWFIGSIDQGTTSSRFIIFNGEGNPVASHQVEFENIYPESG